MVSLGDRQMAPSRDRRQPRTKPSTFECLPRRPSACRVDRAWLVPTCPTRLQDGCHLAAIWLRVVAHLCVMVHKAESTELDTNGRHRFSRPPHSTTLPSLREFKSAVLSGEGRPDGCHLAAIGAAGQAAWHLHGRHRLRHDAPPPRAASTFRAALSFIAAVVCP